ncbi:threonine ammonia-lyase [Chthonobacter albigriseus]|uniref:threonine ammonia-lyase n=1 Tax=Chthonobacter albigriseus TaxID=1683161 RepID=UPI0015EF1E94|nr:threonine ammonia-lyase [Chthonobacter albigriseus]
MTRPDLQAIRAAADILTGQVIRTPQLPAPRLSKLTGGDVVVKYETLQATAAFKERGALVKLSTLTAEERARGVIAMSAGNHAQAVAHHATRLGIKATIVMPVTTPFVKVAATEGFGATVLLEGEAVNESFDAAMRIAERDGLVFVHPYDDWEVIRGQGTIALEMLADDPDLDVLVVPIGGGGLISGMAIAAKALKPAIQVIGVETKLYPSMWAAVRGMPAECGGATLAEGIAVKSAGALTLPVVRELVDDIILVGEAELERAVNAFVTLQKVMAEGAGAAGLAAMLTEPERFRGKRTGLVLCGANIDPRMAASIMMRELAREERIVDIRLAIPDRPGVLGDIATLIGSQGGNILEVSHRRTVLGIPAKGASLDITIEARDGTHAGAICDLLRARGYGVEKVSAL